MIKYEVDDQKIRLDTQGSFVDLVSEINILINAIYSKANNANPALATAFKAMIKSSVNDPDSPVWSEVAPVGDVDVFTLVHRPKKGGDKP